MFVEEAVDNGAILKEKVEVTTIIFEGKKFSFAPNDHKIILGVPGHVSYYKTILCPRKQNMFLKRVWKRQTHCKHLCF